MHPLLPLFPHNAAIDAQGHLTLGGHRAADLAAAHGTPLYVYDIGTIRRQIEAYRHGLAGYGGETLLTYASKAFLCTALARLLAAEDVGLDVASAGEIFIGRHGGVVPAQMHLHGNNKTRLDIEAALDVGVGRIVVDNADELDLLAELAGRRHQPVRVWLRVTPGIGVQTHHKYTVTGTADSKFGVPATEIPALAGQILAGQFGDAVALAGLHAHLGSHFFDAEPVAAAVEVLLDIAAGLQHHHGWVMPELCAGGGWGVRYLPTDPPMPIEPFVSGLAAAVENGCRARGLPLPMLVLEPGRSLVAQAGVALYSVGGRKVLPNGRIYVGVNGGLADNPRPALYQAQYSALLANRAAASATETVAVAGAFCESGDVLIETVELPPAHPGDVLAMPVAGAYQLSMSSNYNGALKPAVIFIDGSEVKLAQRRETLADLVRRDEDT